MKKNNGKTTFMRQLRTTPVLAVITCLVIGSTSIAIVHADTLQQQIDALNAQNNQTQNSLNALQAQATSYQDAINILQTQIVGIQSAISGNQAKQAAIEAQIAANQAELAQQKEFLSSDLKAMYVNGGMTTVEMLASSKNLSDFVDAETYRTAVQNKIQGTLAQIAQLQNELESQQTQVQDLIQSEQSQQNQLASDQAQQGQLLAMNQDQQTAYNTQIKANNTQIAKLQAEQIIQNQKLFGGGLHYGGTGSYPYADATCMNASGNCGPSSESPYNWGESGQPYDPAGWQYRNCTSYAFWRLAHVRGITLTAGYFPNVSASGGRIGYSIPDFRNLGYTVDHNSAGATFAVEGAGPYGPGTYGHIMYVEASDSNTAYVSQYNAAGDGLYSTATVSASTGVWFVHIP